MKFTARFVPDPGLSAFGKVAAALQRVAKCGELFAIKLTRSAVLLKLQRQDEFHAVCKFAVGDLFFHESLIVESKRQNEIAFEVEPLNISNALRAASGAVATSVRLSTRQTQPVLSFHIEITGVGEKFIVIQDCPISLLRGSAVDEVAEPPEPTRSWSVELPPTDSLLQVINRMRQVGGETAVFSVMRNFGGRDADDDPWQRLASTAAAAGNDGHSDEDLAAAGGSELQASVRLQTETPIVTVDTKYPHCHLHSVGHGEKRGAITPFRLKALQTALQISVLIPHEFCLARLVEGRFVMLCLPVLHLPNSHVSCSLWAISEFN